MVKQSAYPESFLRMIFKLNSDTNANNVKLPFIELAAFTPNYMDQTSFRDSFLPSVGNNQSLNNSKKLQYRKLSVKGEAATLLQSIQILDNNQKSLGKCFRNISKTKLKLPIQH